MIDRKNIAAIWLGYAARRPAASISFMAVATSAAGPTGLAQSPKQLRHSTELHPVHNYVHIGAAAPCISARNATKQMACRGKCEANQTISRQIIQDGFASHVYRRVRVYTCRELRRLIVVLVDGHESFGRCREIERRSRTGCLDEERRRGETRGERVGKGRTDSPSVMICACSDFRQ